MCHICQSSRVVLSNDQTTGYKWQEVPGGQEPKEGTEIYNMVLAAALQDKVDFTIEELGMFDEKFFYDSYIKIDNTYYTPAGTCRKCHHRQHDARNNGVAIHLKHFICKQGILTNPLPQRGTWKTKEMKIKHTLDEHEIEYINDKTILDRDSNCEKSASRPDFQVQHMHQELVNIYVEVDENQHKNYDSTCELVRLNDIIVSHEHQRPLVVLRYNPDPFNAGGHRITCKLLPRKDKEAILLRELKHVMKAAAHPETFPALLRVITIGYDCDCANTTECGFVHSTDYPDQESIRQAYNLMQ